MSFVEIEKLKEGGVAERKTVIDISQMVWGSRMEIRQNRFGWEGA